MFKLLVSKTLSSSSIAFLLCGPGIAVRIVGLEGSLGKNGCSLPFCSTTLAVAALAAGLVVVVIGRMVEMGRRVRGCRRDEARRKADIMETLKGPLKLWQQWVEWHLALCIQCGVSKGRPEQMQDQFKVGRLVYA